jgi:hypothetical protein
MRVQWLKRVARVGKDRRSINGGIGAGLGWLDAKSYFHDGSGRLGPFIGWERTFTRYNGGKDPRYWDKIQNAYRDIKSGGQ